MRQVRLQSLGFFLAWPALLVALALLAGPSVALASANDDYNKAKADFAKLEKDPLRSVQRHPYEGLIKRFDKIEKENKNNDLAYRSCFMAARVSENLSLASRVPSDLDEAIVRMRRVAERYPKSRMADDALLAAARMAFERRGDHDLAREILLHLTQDLKRGDMQAQARELLARIPASDPRPKTTTHPIATPQASAATTPTADEVKNPAKKTGVTTAEAAKNPSATQGAGDAKQAAMTQDPVDRIGALLAKAELIRTQAQQDPASTNAAEVEAQVGAAAVLEAEAKLLQAEQPVAGAAPTSTDKNAKQPTVTTPGVAALAYQPKPRAALPEASAQRLARLGRLTSRSVATGTEVCVHLDREVSSQAGEVPAQPAKGILRRAFVDLNLTKVARGLRDLKPKKDPLLSRVRVGQNTQERARVVFELDQEAVLHGPWPCSKGLCFLIAKASTQIDAQPSVQLVNAQSAPEKTQASQATAPPESPTTAATKPEVIAQVQAEPAPPAPTKAAADPSMLPSASSNGGLSLSQQVGLQVKTLVIDPGHGGRDPGAIGPTGLREKDVTLKVAKNLATRLRKELGVKVILTRDKDVYLSLEERANIANEAHADLFVSVHINAAANRSAYGMETFFLNTTDDRYAIRLAARENAESQKSIGDLQFILADLVTKSNVDDSRRLAKLVQRGAIASTRKKYSKVKDLGIKSALFYVLIGVRMPSILFEAAFISNRREEQRLRASAYLDKLAAGMASGIIEFVKAQNTATASRS